MSRNFLIAVFLCVFALLAPASGHAVPAAADLPKEGGKPVLARINGEAITLEEFERVLVEIHSEAADNTMRAMSKPSLLLDRLINARLVLQEARNIGLDELPEVVAAGKTFEEDLLRKMLYTHQVRHIQAPDPKEVEKRYRAAVKEVRIASVLFDKEEDARRMESGIRGGGRFEELAKKAIDAGEAKGSVAGQYVRTVSLSPQIDNVVASLRKGEVSPAIRVGQQFSILKVGDTRYPKDPAARRQAENEALQAKKAAFLGKYSDGLRKKHVVIDQKLVDSIDYDSPEPGFDALRGDGRVVATVKGGAPVTVGELTTALEKKFFHGADRAAEGRKVNRRKNLVLDELLNKRVALMEARKLKLDRTDYFKDRVRENRNSLLFGAFVQKVILPEIKVTDNELATYHEAHIGDYTYPEMVRIQSMAFAARPSAEDAIGKLRKGADFQWLRANADGQADPAVNKDLILFRGELVTARNLSDGIRKAIDGASAGDYRLYADPSKVFYVLDVRERIPAKPIPLDSVRADVEKKVFSDKVQRVLRDWEEKLRKASDIKIYATGKKLDRIVVPGAR